MQQKYKWEFKQFNLPKRPAFPDFQFSFSIYNVIS